MNRRWGKILLLLLAAVLLAGVAQVQESLNRDRDRLGLTRLAPLENAPPVLAFTTVALGGFRGLISNALWMRATELQEADKFFEMVQLADWITKLEPHFVQVWLVQAWNMAYNISVKFKDYPDRWRWVQRGIELLRDDGLRYNPNETLIYRELAWFFQHKMGANLDDAHMYFKQAWAAEMTTVFGGGKPDFDELIHPQTDDARRRSQLLTHKFKLDPRWIKEVDGRYGPLEWRLPEAHAIYWAALGLEKAKLNPTKINKDELLGLRRVIYQSMHLAVVRGRLIVDPFTKTVDLGPNLEIIAKANAAYEQAMAEDEKFREHISRAHRNMLADIVYYLYEQGREAEAAQWFKYLARLYPDQPLFTGKAYTLPTKLTLDEYAVGRVQTDINETSRDHVKAALEGLLVNSYRNLAMDEDEHAAGFKLLARKVWMVYQGKIKGREGAIGLPPLAEIDRDVLNRLLNPESGVPVEMANRLRTKLGLPASTNAPAAGAPGR
jgi:hypothetical protein